MYFGSGPSYFSGNIDLTIFLFRFSIVVTQMLRRILYGTFVFVLAFAILTVSFLQSASVKYAFATPPATPSPSPFTKIDEIDYQLPYPGSILPNSVFWPLKALRDQVWLFLTTDSVKKSELSLLFADKRLAMSETLFKEGNAGLGFSTLTKAEKYLEEAASLEERARMDKKDTAALSEKISLSSLKHRQVIEQILMVAPEDAKPAIIKIESYSMDIYKLMLVGLNSMGIKPPNNPFNGQ